MADLLTPDSPLTPTHIYGGDAGLGDPAEFRAIQVAGGQGANPADLRPGERYATLPIFHEVLAAVPGAAESATVPVCVHLDWVIRPEGERPPWIQGVTDAEVDGEITVRRVEGRWRLHDWRLTAALFGAAPDGQCTGRCGPDPAPTAVRRTRFQPTGTDETVTGSRIGSTGRRPRIGPAGAHRAGHGEPPRRARPWLVKRAAPGATTSASSSGASLSPPMAGFSGRGL